MSCRTKMRSVAASPAVWLWLLSAWVALVPCAVRAEALAAPPSIDAAIRAGDWPTALELLDAELARQPADVRLLARRGDVLVELDRLSEAASVFAAVVKLDPAAAGAWSSLCWVSILQGRAGGARASCERAVALRKDYANTLNLGHTYLLTGDREAAYRWYGESLVRLSSEEELRSGPLSDFDLFTARGWKVAESGAARRWMAESYPLVAAAQARMQTVNAEIERGQVQNAVAAFEDALALYERLLGSDHPATGSAMVALGTAYHLVAGRHDDALAVSREGLAVLERSLGRESAEAGMAMHALTTQYEAAGDFERALAMAEAAVRIAEKTSGPEHADTAGRLLTLGLIHARMNRYAAALTAFERALAINEKIYGADHIQTIRSVTSLGALFFATGNYERAAPLFERAVAASQRNYGTHPATATALTSLASSLELAGRVVEATAAAGRALAILESSVGPEHASIHGVLVELVSLYARAARYEQAIASANRALQIAERQRGPEHLDVATSLIALGDCWLAFGQPARAVALYARAVAIRERILGAAHASTGAALSRLASAHEELGELDRALPMWRRAVAISEQADGEQHVVTALRLEALANVLARMRDFEKALPLASRALAILEQTLGPDHLLVSDALNTLALLHHRAKRYDTAVPLYERALRIDLAHGRGSVQLAIQQGNLAASHAALGHREVAIFFGKQSVNGIQAQRPGLERIGDEVQQSFVSRYAVFYENLAGWLIDAGRLAEAQQVTAMLKEQELYEITRRDAATDPRAGRAATTGVEGQYLGEYDAIAQRMRTASQGLDELERKAKLGELSAQDRARKTSFDAQIADGRKAFERFLSTLETGFARMTELQRNEIARLNLTEVESLQGTLEELGHGAVLVHYLVHDAQLKIILTTPRFQRGYSVAADDVAINRAVAEFRAAIVKRGDVQPAARQLYDWLIAPLAADLDAAGARTLMVALSGSLRYLPFAALHDGKGWLAERYAVAMYTEAARDRIRAEPLADWRLSAFGLTRQVEGFAALPAVRNELAGIVGAQGLPGTMLLDEQFTADSFRSAVDGRPPVLHIASHVVFSPGTETDSFMVLGDGGRLTLADIKTLSFRQLDLLTLSACDTAVGGGQNENGREIEGFGAIAQRRGANAVLATLWPVGDDSTAQFMQSFYRTRQGVAGTTKAEALRQAQLALLRGGHVATAASAQRGASRSDTPAVTSVDSAAPFAHPYFWAPFILMGNWR